MKYLILILLPLTSYGQYQQQDTTQISMAQWQAFKKDRTTGKAVQILGVLAVGTYFFLEKGYDTKIDNGDLTAKRPSKAIPIIGCAAMAIGFSIDMGAINHIVKRRRSKQP